MNHVVSHLAEIRNLPNWVSDDIRLYLDHTEGGRSIRSLARDSGCHASTILRKVRKTESRRDDPLVDRVLIDLGKLRRVHRVDHTNDKKAVPIMADDPVDEQTLKRDAIRVLRALLQPGAVLAVVPDVETAVVVCETDDGRPRQIATVKRAIAEAMALQSWISCTAQGKVARYYISQTGRVALNQFMAQEASQKAGFSEASTPFTSANSKPARPRRAIGAESPLQVLARRREKSGQPYLSPGLVQVGERLRMDFELTQLDAPLGQGWDAIMHGSSGANTATGQGPDLRQMEARKRLEKALTFLGPELGDVVLITCCRQQGMEHAEKQLVMPARSGKFVLKIALNMLARHYQSEGDDAHNMIG